MLNKKSKQKSKENQGKEKPFRISAKSILLTYPQCEKPKQWLMDFLIEKGADIIVVSSENHHESEGKHLHAYAEWKKKLNVKNERYFDKDGFHPNIGKDKSRGRKNSKSSKHDMIKYVVKDGDYIEHGINVKDYLKSVQSKKTYVGEKLIKGEIDLVGAVEENPELLFQLGNLQKNLNLFFSLKKQKAYNGKRLCFWIYGKPGIGKSLSVRKLYPKIYVKNQTKWWDGYVNQNEVLIEDVDKYCLEHEMKIWADPYEFVGEIKCGTICPCYDLLFVTSNYMIEEIFKEEKMQEAIKRRFIYINAEDFLDENGEFFDLKLALKAMNYLIF